MPHQWHKQILSRVTTAHPPSVILQHETTPVKMKHRPSSRSGNSKGKKKNTSLFVFNGLQLDFIMQLTSSSLLPPVLYVSIKSKYSSHWSSDLLIPLPCLAPSPPARSGACPSITSECRGHPSFHMALIPRYSGIPGRCLYLKITRITCTKW